MCDVMPTISEDSISQRSSQFGDEANFEQLMVSMLDERDKLVESLKNEQEKTSEFELRVKELEKERDSLNRQLNQNLPQVSLIFMASISASQNVTFNSLKPPFSKTFHDFPKVFIFKGLKIMQRFHGIYETQSLFTYSFHVNNFSIDLGLNLGPF